MPDVLDLDVRRRIVGFVRNYPGLHVREIARQLGEAQALVDYHLPKLEDAGLVVEEREGRYSRIFPTANRAPRPAEPRDRRVLALLRDRHLLQLVLLLLENGPMRHKDLTDHLEVPKSVLSYYLGKLLKAKLVEKTDAGFVLVDGRRVSALLARYNPTRDLVDEFADLWSALYG